MRKIVAIGPGFVVLAVMAAFALIGPAAVQKVLFARTQAEVILARQVLDQDNILEQIDAATRRVAAVVEPSVVHIEVSLRPGGADEPSFGPGASGAGWVYDELGHLVTNAHVVGAAESARVEFSNGRTLPAKVIYADAFTDIAVLRVDPGPGLIPVARDSSRPVSVGDRVYAFGSPFNFKFSMSEGIVSGLGRNPRTGGSINTFTNYIQTDAAVNPGNSGGALVNVRGELVGMNVAIATGRGSGSPTQGQSAGISFAIPLGVIESVVDQAISNGRVSRGFLGISMSRDSSRGGAVDVVDAEGRFVTRGVEVTSVSEGLPAAKAGIRPGDIITEIQGQPVREQHQLRSIVTAARPGSDIEVTLWREHQTVETIVHLAEFPEEVLQSDAVDPALRNLGVLLLERRISDAEMGVVAEIVRERDGGYQAGLRPGDVIVRVGDDQIADLVTLYGALTRADFLLGRPVRITVMREGSERELTLRAPR
jgi:S1-C subfamily serine protease